MHCKIISVKNFIGLKLQMFGPVNISKFMLIFSIVLCNFLSSMTPIKFSWKHEVTTKPNMVVTQIKWIGWVA